VRVALILSLFVLAVAAACGAQNIGTNATPTAAPASSPTPAPGADGTVIMSPGAVPPNLPFPFTPGKPIPPIIAQVIQHASTSNVSGLEALVKKQDIACTTAQGAGGPPKCRPGDSAGTMYSVFPTGACQGEWAADPSAALTSLFSAAPQLYAAVEVKAPNPDPEPSWPKGQYAVLFTTGGANPGGIYFVLDNTNILRAHAMCAGGSGSEIKQLRDLGASAFLIPPR